MISSKSTHPIHGKVTIRFNIVTYSTHDTMYKNSCAFTYYFYENIGDVRKWKEIQYSKLEHKNKLAFLKCFSGI